MNLYEKLSKIRKMVAVIQKSKQAYGYKYVTEEDILAKITAGMDKYNVSLIPSVKSNTLVTEKYQYIDKKGKDVYEILLQADMKFTWVNNDEPSEIVEVDWILTGQQSDISMAFGAALSYCNRYFLLKYFQIATVDDDPDNYRSKQQEAEEFEAQQALKKIQQEILDVAKEKTDLGIDKEDVFKKISEYSGGKRNPNAIKDIEVAKKVLETIKIMEVKNK